MYTNQELDGAYLKELSACKQADKYVKYELGMGSNARRPYFDLKTLF